MIECLQTYAIKRMKVAGSREQASLTGEIQGQRTLLGLPMELRLQIYREVLQEARVSADFNFRLTCRQINEELDQGAYAFARTRFIIRGFQGLNAAFQLKERLRNAIASVEVQVTRCSYSLPLELEDCPYLPTMGGQIYWSFMVRHNVVGLLSAFPNLQKIFVSKGHYQDNGIGRPSDSLDSPWSFCHRVYRAFQQLDGEIANTTDEWNWQHQEPGSLAMMYRPCLDERQVEIEVLCTGHR
jgi:hypothetical protein